MKKKKLTFFTMNNEVFLQDIILGLRNDYHVKSYIRGAEKEYYQILGDTDIAWYEWCDDFTASCVSRSSSFIKNIIRFHSYELFTDMPKRVDWTKVSCVVFVSETLKKLAMEKFKIPSSICKVVHNGVNTDRFFIPKDKKYNKKIAFIGFINYKKGAVLLPHIWKYIKEYDPEIEMHIAGEHQDERIGLYYNYFFNEANIKMNFDGWVKDIPKYLEDKDFIISTSIFESFQYSLSEGMAQGCIPLIHNWCGSKALYPEKYIFNFAEDCVKIIDDFTKLSDINKQKEREYVRKHVVDNFTLQKQITEIKELVDSL